MKGSKDASSSVQSPKSMTTERGSTLLGGDARSGEKKANHKFSDKLLESQSFGMDNFLAEQADQAPWVPERVFRRSNGGNGN
jgi:hypothetical protein